jgi:hypothetical protein
MTELADRLDRDPTPKGFDAMRHVVLAWSRRDPDGAAEWMRPLLDFQANYRLPFVYEPDAEAKLAKEWAAASPDKAIEYVRSNPSSSLAASLLELSWLYLDKKSHSEWLEILRSIPSEEARRRTMSHVFARWAREDLSQALSVAKSLPSASERDRMVGEILTMFARSNPSEAFRQYSVSGMHDPNFVPILAGWSSSVDPALTATWLDKVGTSSDIERCGVKIVCEWAQRDPAAAFDWAIAHGISILKETNDLGSDFEWTIRWRDHVDALVMEGRMNVTALQMGLSRNAKGVSEWLKSLPIGAERERMIEEAMVLDGGSNEELLAMAVELPADSQARLAENKIRRMGEDVNQLQMFAEQLPAGPERAAAWRAIARQLNKPLPLPPGPDRDEMLAGLARYGGGGPAQNWEWIKQITDLERRRQAFDDVAFSRANGPDITGANRLPEFLGLPGVPEEWKRPWRGR